MSGKMTISSAQCRAARGLVDMDQATLAQRSQVALPTIASFENGQRVPGANNLAAIRETLEAAGVEFINGGQPGVRMKKAPPVISDEAALPDIPETDGEQYDGAPV